MLRIKFLTILTTIVFVAWHASGQATLQFNSKSNACREERIELTNLSDGVEQSEWDFCESNLQRAPQFLNSTNINSGGAVDLKLLNENGNWFAFVCDGDANKIHRISFGNNLSNNPTISTAASLSLPTGIEIAKVGDEWFGFVGNFFATGQLFLLKFGNSLDNAPVVQDVSLPPNAIVQSRSIRLTRQGNDNVLFVVNWGTEKLTRINFGETISGTIKSLDKIDVPDALNLLGLDLLDDGTTKYGIVTSVLTGRIFKINFGSSWLNASPVLEEVFHGGAITSPTNVKLEYEGGHFYGLLMTNAGKLFRLDFGASLAQNNPVVNDDGTFSDMVNVRGFGASRFDGDYYSIASSFTTNKVYTFSWPQSCDASLPRSIDVQPELISFNSQGIFPVTLRAIDPQNFRTIWLTKNVNVSNDIAPTLSIEILNQQCTGVTNEFTSNTDPVMLTYLWKFGNGDESMLPDPSYHYPSPGKFPLNLTITDGNECQNFSRAEVSIFSEPSFTILNTPICTNQNLQVDNLTFYSVVSEPSWKWTVNGVEVSGERNLTYPLTSNTSLTIELTASNSQCEYTHEEVITEVLDGTPVDFLIDGHCQNSTIEFIQNPGADIVSSYWEIETLGQHNEPRPSVIFSSPGTFEVTLYALNSLGCTSDKTHLVEINAQPMVDFIIEAPPSSCSGYTSQFTDLTPAIVDGQIELWQWSFNDDGATSVLQNPSHIFRDPGDYNVELTVATEDGCSNSINKSVTILKSPAVILDNGPSCLNKRTNFTASSDDAIQYFWEIGTSYYEAQNAVHIFNSPGTYLAKLNVLGSNDCVTTATRQIIVPIPVNPVFSVVNNCRDFESRFTSIPSAADPIVTRNWNFAGEGTSTEINPTHTFKTTGNKPVVFQVTTTSGCVYVRQELVNVIEPPVANFNFTPDFGVPPQEISFTNSSANASLFNWNFGDGSSSDEISPKHTFTELGNYEVELTVTNNAACQASTSKVVPMVAPLPDVDLSLMTITPNGDGTSKVIITIANKGNTFLKNLPVRLDVSGNVTLETIVAESIAPFSMHNLILNFGIAQTQTLEFLCASTTLQNDLHPEGNRICRQLQSEVAILSPYPNPVKDALTVEWVAQESEKVEVKLVDTDGKVVIDSIEISTAGLNLKTLDLSRFRAGIYILRIVSPTRTKTHRIFVSN